MMLKLFTEQGDYPCDHGNKISELKCEFSHHNFSKVPEVWWTENETYRQVTLKYRALFHLPLIQTVQIVR